MPVDPLINRYDSTLQAEFEKLLNQHYPTVLNRGGVEQRINNSWRITLHPKLAQVVHVVLTNRDPEGGYWGFNCPLSGYWKKDSRNMLRMADELLRRYNIVGRKVTIDAIKSLPTDILGNPIGDHSK